MGIRSAEWLPFWEEVFSTPYVVSPNAQFRQMVPDIGGQTREIVRRAQEVSDAKMGQIVAGESGRDTLLSAEQSNQDDG